MRRGTWLKGLLMALALLIGLPATAQELFMARSTQSFPEAMLTLQQALRDQGYQISRVQRVDIGLTQSGYKTDKYRVVFYGRKEEVASVIDAHPELAAFLPLKIAIFAEAGDTLLVANNPRNFDALFSHPDLAKLTQRWADDLRVVLDKVRIAE